MKMNKIYPSDLDACEWDLIAHFFVRDKDSPRKRGREAYKNNPRDMVNAIFYRSKTGCQWRLLPKDFPPHSAVSTFFYRLVHSGQWQKIQDALRKTYRKEKGDKPSPTYAITDSQSVKTAHGGEQIGYDSGKKNQG
jgi:transposase